MRSGTGSNYASQQYLLSPRSVSSADSTVVAATVAALPGQQQPLQPNRQHQHQHNSRTNNLAGGLPMASANASGRIQQQIAAATTVASNYPHPQAPLMASNKLDSAQLAPQLAPAPAQVHYHNGSGGGGIGSFKAALRHPQKFIHNLYSGSNTGKSSQQQVAHSKQVLKPTDKQVAAQHQKLIQHQQHQPQVSRFSAESPASNDAYHLEPRQEQYASQLRSSPLLQRFQQQQQQQSQHKHQHQQLFSASQQMPTGGSQQQKQPPVVASPASGGIATSSTVQTSLENAPLNSEHRTQQQVNFNRNTDQIEEAGESRKKKYLTAKYGQQQMSLIKKRLKIEMWLYEQLQELAKNTKSQAELDEIEIDLDQLLDMDDDETRRRWLKKTLEPFEDLQPKRIDKFINDVLDQSKLL